MSQPAPGVAETIGDTPVIELRHVAQGLPARVFVKLEPRNPGGSVKDRIGAAMVADAEERGLITPGESVIVEPTSGNTGIALAMVGAERGYRVVLTMPESMSLERRRLAAAYGAELVLTPKELGMKGAVERAETIAAETPGAWIAGQFDNPANPRAHYRTTGPEVWEALGDAGIGAFVAGVGTGGTISGAGRFLKERDGSIRAIAVEPAESPIIGQRLAGEDLTPAPHLIQGIGANFIPNTLDLEVLDGVECVTGPDAIATSRRLAAEEGLLVGISAGANVTAALRLAALPEYAGRRIVTVAPDTGERYLSTALWEGVG
ncbi:MAG: cysteine synthase A [Actinobacteria bacterium]|nr:MAG: cysteine synthase A [Actinomycetota bacterium]